MTRYLTPLIFAAATFYVHTYNQSHTDRKLLVPFVDLMFPASADDPQVLGERSVVVAAVLTGVITVWTVLDHLRAVRQRRQLEDLE